MLGYMPARYCFGTQDRFLIPASDFLIFRDDFEDFDRSNEAHVSQMGVKSVDDEDIDIAMKLGDFCIC